MSKHFKAFQISNVPSDAQIRIIASGSIREQTALYDEVFSRTESFIDLNSTNAPDGSNLRARFKSAAKIRGVEKRFVIEDVTIGQVRGTLIRKKR